MYSFIYKIYNTKDIMKKVGKFFKKLLISYINNSVSMNRWIYYTNGTFASTFEGVCEVSKNEK